MADNVEVTKELLRDLRNAQIIATRDSLEAYLTYGGDDGYDYVTAALELCQTMLMLDYDTVLIGPGSLDALLNTPSIVAIEDDLERYTTDEKFTQDNGFPHLSMMACDGIASEFYNLNCPALPKED